MIQDKDLIDKYLISFKKNGEVGFYETLVSFASISINKTSSPTDIEYLSISEYFFSLYRKTGEEDYFNMAKCFRRAAHKVFRLKNKINPEKEINKKFLSIIK